MRHCPDVVFATHFTVFSNGCKILATKAACGPAFAVRASTAVASRNRRGVSVVEFGVRQGAHVETEADLAAIAVSEGEAGFPVPFGIFTSTESDELRNLEEIIGRSLKTFMEVGNALMTIREKRLYRVTHDAFEAYCNERWELSKTHVNRLIDASKIAENLTPIGVIPASESVVRPLSPLSPSQQREAWLRAVDTSPNGRPTAAHVESIAREYRDVTEPELVGTRSWSLDDAVDYLGSKLYEISQRWPKDGLEVMVHQLRSLADELLEYGELRQ